MTDFIMDELDDDMGDFDAGGSTNSDNEKVDSILIKKILCEMKSEFNRATCSVGRVNLRVEAEEEPNQESDHEEDTTKQTKLGNGFLLEKMDEESKGSDKDSLSLNYANSSDIVDDTEDEVNSTKGGGKPRIVLTLRTGEDESVNERKRHGRVAKENVKSKALPEFTSPEETVECRRRRSLRNKAEKVEQDVGLKRSSRRMSKELTHESVLQSAIALKEKSFSSLNNSEDKPYRRSSRIIDNEQKNSSTTKRYRSSRSSHNENTDSSANNSPKTVTRLKANCDVDIKVEPEDEGLDNGASDDSAVVKNSAKGSNTPFRTQRRQLRQIRDNDNGSVGPYITPGSRHSADSDSSRAAEETPKMRSEVLSGGVKRKVDEDLTPQAKKLRQYLLSPMGVEGSEPPVMHDSTSRSLMAGSGGLCECQNNNGLYPSVASFTNSQYCRAIDCFENRIIGCCNPVDSDTPLLRPSKTVPHLLMCDVHMQRLMRHNSCPSCGMFCTQGVFRRCVNQHDYHKDCEMKKNDIGVCPHCGSEDSQDVRISLGAHKYPVFLPMQKPPNKCPSARMSFGNGTSVSGEKSSNEDFGNLVPQVCLTLPSGRKMSAEGIPSVEKEKLENLLHACSSQNDLLPRHSYRNMYQAAKTGDAEKMIQMLGCGMNPNQVMRDGGAVCALHAATSSGHLAIVHLLVQAGANTEVLDKDQNTPLMLAAFNKHNHIVKYLVKAGASVSFKGAEGMTALHIAAKEGNLEACHYLLSSASTPPSYVDTVDDGRWTPLVWAAENCHSEVVRFLLEKKADPQIRDGEMNIALHWAAFAGNMEITEDLLNYGSNINLSNAYGDTPLHISARQGAENCVVLLLSRGARVDMMNKAGHIPRDCVSDPNSYCYIAIDLNMQLRKLMVTTQAYPQILSNDISRGYETNPIQCVNMIDDDGLPTDFTYISENCLTTNITIDRRITSLTSCKCEDMCTGSGCLCAKISLRCWYDSKGKLLPDFNFEDPPMIFECNQTCSCNALTCKNRVVQRGIKVRLQLCKTRHKNWGVITLRDIPKGSYVCEYIGEIISDCEADTREDDSYLFDLDNRDGETYCIDARRYGNITRFINHSCKPNLLPVRVFIGHHDLHFPRIAFFANRDIPANEELGFDYGEKFWIIKYKSFTCKCSADSCRYSETTIQQTLEKYKENLQMEESLAIN